MEFVNEYALHVAVLLPVGVVALINLLLALTGESGTLLLPSLRGYPPVEPDESGPVVVASAAGMPAEVIVEIDLRKAA